MSGVDLAIVLCDVFAAGGCASCAVHAGADDHDWREARRWIFLAVALLAMAASVAR